MDRKSLRMLVQDLKEISSYQGIPMGSMWADALTKEKEMHQDLKNLLHNGELLLEDTGINKIISQDGKLRCMM